MEKLLESYEIRLKLVLEELENETCKDQKKALRDRTIYYNHFIFDIKEEIQSKKVIQKMITKIESEKALTPCIKFKWGDCFCKSECKRGFSKE
jgi:hypothetical protein